MELDKESGFVRDETGVGLIDDDEFRGDQPAMTLACVIVFGRRRANAVRGARTLRRRGGPA
jgi:hypothetical protein